jgi:hypothetical protein
MKTIEIKTKLFFELLKTRETSMWSMFAEMINEQEKQLIRFLDKEGKEIAHYILPTNQEQLDQDQKSFANSFKEKLNADKN